MKLSPELMQWDQYVPFGPDSTSHSLPYLSHQIVTCSYVAALSDDLVKKQL